MITLASTPDVDSMLIGALRDKLPEILGMEVQMGEPIEDISFAFNPQRNQHQSTPILEQLGKTHSQGEGGKVLGIVDVDLYAPELNFVFGEADLRAGMAVVSLTRLRQDFYGLPNDEDLFFQRTLKEAVHELGHTLGLLHCGESTCVMHFSNSLEETDRKSHEFCETCKAKWTEAQAAG
jgi:archaemetzincin